jgi:hypothetical protein
VLWLLGAVVLRATGVTTEGNTGGGADHEDDGGGGAPRTRLRP